MTWGDYMNFNAKVGTDDQVVSCRAVGTYNFRLEKSLFRYYLQIYFWHVIPGIFSDLLLRLLGQEPRLVFFFFLIKHILISINLITSSLQTI